MVASVTLDATSWLLSDEEPPLETLEERLAGERARERTLRIWRRLQRHDRGLAHATCVRLTARCPGGKRTPVGSPPSRFPAVRSALAVPVLGLATALTNLQTIPIAMM